MNNRWPISDRVRGRAAAAVGEGIEIATEQRDPKMMASMLQIMVAMEGQNQRDDHHRDRMELAHNAAGTGDVQAIEANAYIAEVIDAI